jgi:hypothetical protein
MNAAATFTTLPYTATTTQTASGPRPFIPVLAGEERAAHAVLSEAHRSAYTGKDGDFQDALRDLVVLAGGNRDRAMALLDQYDPDPMSDWL